MRINNLTSKILVHADKVGLIKPPISALEQYAQAMKIFIFTGQVAIEQIDVLSVQPYLTKWQKGQLQQLADLVALIQSPVWKLRESETEKVQKKAEKENISAVKKVQKYLKNSFKGVKFASDREKLDTIVMVLLEIVKQNYDVFKNYNRLTSSREAMLFHNSMVIIKNFVKPSDKFEFCLNHFKQELKEIQVEVVES